MLDRTDDDTTARTLRVPAPPPIAVAVVEDDFVLRETICAALRDQGYDTHAAATLPNARKILGVVRPAVVVIDLALSDPSGDGEALLREVRGAEDDDVGTAPILISALPRAAHVAARHGVAFLPKPFELDTLIALVRERAA